MDECVFGEHDMQSSVPQILYLELDGTIFLTDLSKQHSLGKSKMTISTLQHLTMIGLTR